MPGLTREQNLNAANITNISVTLSHLQDGADRGFGTFIKSLGVPAVQSFTGLTSDASQTAPYPGWVLGIATGGANKTLIYDGAAGAGEVLVEYTDGVPTFTFGDGAVTAYDLWQAAMPVGLKASLEFAP